MRFWARHLEGSFSFSSKADPLRIDCANQQGGPIEWRLLKATGHLSMWLHCP